MILNRMCRILKFKNCLALFEEYPCQQKSPRSAVQSNGACGCVAGPNHWHASPTFYQFPISHNTNWQDTDGGVCRPHLFPFPPPSPPPSAPISPPPLLSTTSISHLPPTIAPFLPTYLFFLILMVYLLFFSFSWPLLLFSFQSSFILTYITDWVTDWVVHHPAIQRDGLGNARILSDDL